MEVIIRKANSADVEVIHKLICELAVYEKAENHVKTTPEELLRDGFGASPVFECIVAEAKNEVVGFALFYTAYSTWKGKTLYLEDFLVTESLRGNGIGKLLFEEVIREAKRRGVRRMAWQVLEWNERAINFYKKYNTVLDSEWINGRFYWE
ncbi:MAG: GNAT family N-acetyltransferase [Flavobacteriales bacterium]